MQITKDFFERIREQVSVSEVARNYLQLTKRGVEYTGLCPFHNEKSPSFTINDIKKFYHCFGCGAHGDVIRLLSEKSGLDYKQAAIKIAETHGIPIPKVSKEEEKIAEEIDEIYRVLALATEFFQNNLNNEAKSYLASRNITNDLIHKFAIGYAPGQNKLLRYLEDKKIPLFMIHKAGLLGKKEDNSFYEIFRDRIIFPIHNVYGKVIGFGGRSMGSAMPKYLNSPETLVFKKNMVLYGENKAIGMAYKKSQMIVVEGYIDVIAMQSHGFENTVAILGTALTQNHLSKIWKSSDEIVICFDGDTAGMSASTKALNHALPHVTYSKNISFVILPNADPDELLHQKGKAYISTMIKQKKPLSEMIWYISTYQQQHTTPEQKTHLEQTLEEYAIQITDKALKRNYLQFFKDQCWKYFRIKKTTNKDYRAPTISNGTEIDTIERGIIALLIQHPNLLQEYEIHETLSSITIRDIELSDILYWLLSYQEAVDIKQLNNDSEKTSFHQLFLILSSADMMFLGITSQAMETPKLAFTILVKKHNLTKMKEEYASLTQDMNDQNLEKVRIYQKAIIQEQKDIESISESLTQSRYND